MKRDPRLTKLSWDHHHGLVMALRIEKELSGEDADIGRLYSDLLAFWAAGLLPHFHAEEECLLGRLIRHVSGSHDAVRKTQGDHLGLAGLVTTMRDTGSLADRREALRQFGRDLRDHIRWEEATLFALTEGTLTAAEMDALGADLEERIPDVVPAPAGSPPPQHRP